MRQTRAATRAATGAEAGRTPVDGDTLDNNREALSNFDFSHQVAEHLNRIFHSKVAEFTKLGTDGAGVRGAAEGAEQGAGPGAECGTGLGAGSGAAPRIIEAILPAFNAELSAIADMLVAALVNPCECQFSTGSLLN